MKILGKLSGLALVVAMASCGSSDNNTPDAGGGGFTQPTGTVAVNFTVDDTANKVYEQGDLQWKGSMLYDSTTRTITKDSTWTGPWAPLYDDGPWNVGTPGGHEPIGSTAGDHKWGVTIFVTPPATGSDTYEYGLNDDYYQTTYGNGWVWIGSNGTFTVNAGDTAPVTAQGQTFPAFGTTDLQLTIDLANLGPGTWDTSMVRVKGSAWAWGNVTLTVANNKAVFTLSDSVGTGHPFKHTGLLSSGDKPEFIFVFGTGDGKEYKDVDGNALATGVTAGVKASGASSFTPVNITLADNKNTTVTVP